MVQQKTILVNLINQVKNLEKVKEQNKELQNTERRVRDVSNSMLKNARIQGFYDEQMKRTGKSGADIKKAMGNMGAQFDEFGNVINMNGQQFRNFNQQLDTAIIRSQRFQSEYLGVMFAGMALSRTMSRLTETSKEWLGTNEILSTTMGVVTLPAMMELLERGILPLSEAIMNLDEDTQMAIGLTITGLNIIGQGASLVGQAGLGLYALEYFFPNALSKVGGAAGAGRFLIKASVGIGLSVAGLTMMSSAIEEEDVMKAVQSAIMTGVGAAFTASALGASIGTAAIVGTVAVGVGVAVSYFLQSKNIGKDLMDAGVDLDDLGVSAARPMSTPATLSGLFGDEERALGMTFLERKSGIGSIAANLIRGSRAVGGTIPENGLYNLHQGETVLRKGQANNEKNITINYNITASSMQEFESKLRESERRITSDIRRMAR